MYPRAFEYAAPASLDEAGALLAATPGARVLAGGASLVPMLKLRLAAPELLVDLRRIPDLASVNRAAGRVVVGAMATHARVAAAAGVPAALADAAAGVGDAQVRNQGTVCGSFAHADSAADEPGAALALGAVMVVTSVGGERTVPAAEFFVDAFTTALEPGEILAAARFPEPGPDEGSAYVKIGRRGGANDYPVAGAAAWIRRAQGRIEEVRVAVTGATARPSLVPVDGLVGSPGAPDDVATATRGIGSELPILADLHGSVDYKAHLVEVVAGRALRLAMARAT